MTRACLFAKEIAEVAWYMQQNDPNGEYTAASIIAQPKQALEVLDQWCEDCDGDIPGWLDKCIDYVMLLIV